MELDFEKLLDVSLQRRSLGAEVNPLGSQRSPMR